jgi:hypothetical protein
VTGWLRRSMSFLLILWLYKQDSIVIIIPSTSHHEDLYWYPSIWRDLSPVDPTLPSRKQWPHWVLQRGSLGSLGKTLPYFSRGRSLGAAEDSFL